MIISILTTKLPVGEIIEIFVGFLQDNLRSFFRKITEWLDFGLETFEAALMYFHPLLLIALIVAIAYRIAGKGVSVFTLLGMLFIHNLGLWEPTMRTLSMVVVATVICIAIGGPVGILTAKNQLAHKIVMPIMDFMQTMPAFVYLIPAVSFFGLGKVPGVVATIIFAIPPAIRLTGLGIRQVPVEMVEAADAFGSTGMQKLLKVQLPLALPTIMAGINQTIMLSLSMVVIAAMIAAGGLGREVWSAIQRMEVGKGFEAGLAVVVLAIILDRITQNIAKSNK